MENSLLLEQKTVKSFVFLHGFNSTIDEIHLGKFLVLKESDLSLIKTVEHRNQEVSDIKFSPGKIFQRTKIFSSIRFVQMVDTLPLEHMTISLISTIPKLTHVRLFFIDKKKKNFVLF